MNKQVQAKVANWSTLEIQNRLRDANEVLKKSLGPRATYSEQVEHIKKLQEERTWGSACSAELRSRGIYS